MNNDTLLKLLTPVKFEKKIGCKGKLSRNTITLTYMKNKSYYLYFGKNSIFSTKYKSLGIYEMDDEVFLVGKEDTSENILLTNPNKGFRANSVNMIEYLIDKFKLKKANKVNQLFTINKVAGNIFKLDINP
jgi:hypothetical protein